MKGEREDNSLIKQIKDASKGLYYVSESDAKVSAFSGPPADAVTKENVLSAVKAPADAAVEERNFDELFTRLTTLQDWFGDEEKATASKYAALRDLLKNNLRDLKVFKIGHIQIDLYAVGLDAENHLAGIKTKAVET
jgi:Nuclease A inhibitor-like protein